MNFWDLRNSTISYTFKIQITTQAHHLFDLIVYISSVNPFFNSLSYIFDMSYHLFKFTCSFLYCLLVHMRNTSVVSNFY